MSRTPTPKAALWITIGVGLLGAAAVFGAAFLAGQVWLGVVGGCMLGVCVARLTTLLRPVDPSLDQASRRGAARADLPGEPWEGRNLRSVLDAVESPVLATDARGVVVLCNAAAQTFFAERPFAIVGRPLEDLFTQAEVLGQHAAALAGATRQGQVRFARADGVRVFQVLTTPSPAPARSGEVAAVITLRDITELATAVQLKTDFVANASHELRTPLSSIRAAVETLSDGAWDDPPMRERLAQMISSNVVRLEDMVRDLLDLSRLESAEAPVQPRPVRLSEIASTLLETFEPVAKERSLTLEFDLPASVEHLNTDPKLLLLVLRNLVDNATKFAYPNTSVRIVGEPFETPSARAPGLRLRVIDSGIGIPLAHQQRIFERFYQVDPARAGTAHRRGTGLGLAIVKHALKALGGSISVDSIWKEGTTMTLELPGVVETTPNDRPVPADLHD